MIWKWEKKKQQTWFDFAPWNNHPQYKRDPLSFAGISLAVGFVFPFVMRSAAIHLFFIILFCHLWNIFCELFCWKRITLLLFLKRKVVNIYMQNQYEVGNKEIKSNRWFRSAFYSLLSKHKNKTWKILIKIDCETVFFLVYVLFSFEVITKMHRVLVRSDYFSLIYLNHHWLDSVSNHFGWRNRISSIVGVMKNRFPYDMT